jgi:hypothetical protein
MNARNALVRTFLFWSLLGSSGAFAQVTTGEDFNAYMLEAVEELARTSAGQGYDKDRFYSKSTPYADGVVRANAPPLTMCVAAVAEVMITAINRYVEKTGDRSPYAYLPPSSWNSMRPQDIRSHIWVDHHLDSYGTADALVTFAIGRRVKFSELRPGAVINLNRTNGSGHAVIFMNYLGRQGETLPAHTPEVAGFRYFSAQGKGLSKDAGFGYRSAFFAVPGKQFCPVLEDKSILRDCDVKRSAGQDTLNTGYLLLPAKWDAKLRDRNLKAIKDRMYKRSGKRGRGFPGLPANPSRKTFERFITQNDTMQLNPKFKQANETTDDQ